MSIVKGIEFGGNKLLAESNVAPTPILKLIQKFRRLLLRSVIALSFALFACSDAVAQEDGIKFVFPKGLIDGVKMLDASSEDNYFFTCTEHPDYPLGKPYGPYSTERNCLRAMARHQRATRHTDMVMWSGTDAGHPATGEIGKFLKSDAAMKIAEGDAKELSVDLPAFLSEAENAVANARARQRCFCVGDCVKGTGDSSHFRRTVDVPCSLSTEEKKKRLFRAMLQHYIDAGHVTDWTDLERVFRDMRRNIRIRCYTVNASRVISDKSKLDLDKLGLTDEFKKEDIYRFTSERKQVYAGPNVFGPWSVVASHIGRVSYKISVEPIGNTVVVGEVRFYDTNNRRVTKGFFKEVTIQTGNSVANVEVRLKGVPFGSSCWVTIE